jgi:hypothetical protein
VKVTDAVAGVEPPVLPVIVNVLAVTVSDGVPAINPVDVLKVSPAGSAGLIE